MSSSLFRASYLPLICLSTNQNIEVIHSLRIRIEWSTGNGSFMSSSHLPIYIKLYPDVDIKYLSIYYLFTGPAKKVFRVRKRKVRVPPKVQRTAASEGMLRLEAGPSTEKVWEVINMVTSEQEEEEEVGEGDISLLRY